MSDAGTLCPACEKPIEREGERFCSWCRFPVMKIADKYRLLKKLGEGGVGEVYLARHLDLSRDELRVIKFIKQELLSSESVLKRFRREMEVTSMLSRRNQHIIQIYDDFGEVPGFGYFYVMEFVDGDTLRQEMIACKRFAPERSLAIFEQLCGALAVVHQEGVIHRDLKPENILLTKRAGEEDFVKVIDFGLNKFLHGTAQTALTQGGIGTPAYMSPEQCMNQDIDTRSDIYALGIILYELLTGRLPFDFDEKTTGGMAAFAAHVMHHPIPLRDRAPQLHFSRSCERMVMRALSKMPQDRYASAEEFWRAVQAFGGDLRQELPTDSWLLQELEEVEKNQPARGPTGLASGILDAVPMSAGGTLLESPPIHHMVTFPVEPQAPRPPPSRRRQALMMLVGFGLASLLFAGLGFWWLNHVPTQLDVPPEARQALTLPDAARLVRAMPKAPEAPVEAGKGGAIPKGREPQPRRIIRPATRRPRRRSRRRPKREKPKATKAPRPPAPRPQPKIEDSPAYRALKARIDGYLEKGDRRLLTDAARASAQMVRLLEKKKAREPLRVQAYRQVIALYAKLKVLLRSHSKFFQGDASHAWFGLAMVAFARFKKLPFRTLKELDSQKRALRRHRDEANHAADLFLRAWKTHPMGKMAICAMARQADAYYLHAKRIERYFRALERRKNWSLGRGWRKGVWFVSLKSFSFRARQLYRKVRRRSKYSRSPYNAKCVQWAKRQLRKLRPRRR